MDKSVQFYRDVVGLKVNRRMTTADNLEICFLGEGETQVELISGRKYAVSCGVGVSLGFEVKSLEDMMDFVREKELPVSSGPFQPTPRIKFFFVEDPDGYSVQFVENMQ
jgi:lactoylglutathione lyase